MWETPELPFPATSRDQIANTKKWPSACGGTCAEVKVFCRQAKPCELKHVHEPDEWAKIPLLTKTNSVKSLQKIFGMFSAFAHVPTLLNSGDPVGRQDNPFLPENKK